MFVINIENKHYGDFFSLNIEGLTSKNIVLEGAFDTSHQLQIPQKIYDKPKFKTGADDKELAFDAIVQGMKALGWLDDPKKQVKGKKNEAFGAILEGMKNLGWDDKVNEAANINSGKKIEEIELTDQETTNENLRKRLKPLLQTLRGNSRKYKILIYGQIECEKKEIEKSVNRYFHDLNLHQNEWEIEYCIKTRDIKNFHMGTLKIGQSSYSLIATANIPQHKTKGNTKGNILATLRKPGYVPFITICNPKKQPTANQIINKLENYFLEKIEEIRKPRNPLDFYGK